MKLTYLVFCGFCLALVVLPLGCGNKKPQDETFRMELSPGEGSGPAELLSRAQTARTPEEKLTLFRQLAQTYPDSPQADDAQFMTGFLLKENLGKPEKAAEAFDVLKTKYPDSEWIDDAESMMGDDPGD